jgi:FlaA1/EpsC-like NDP-sugar epimerase
MAGLQERVVITRNRARLIGFFVVSDVIAIILSYLWSFGLRFTLVFVDPAKGVPPFGSYLAVLPLYLATHLAIFYFQGFYKSKLRRTNLDDMFFIGLNAVLTILVVWAILLWIVTYLRGQVMPFGVTLIEPSRAFLIFYFVSVILTI